MSTLEQLLTDWLPEQRWFSGKGRGLTAVEQTPVPLTADGLVVLHRVQVTYGDGQRDVFQVPISRRTEPVERLERALIGELDADPDGRRWLYDAMRDRETTALWLELLAAEHVQHGLSFTIASGADIPPPGPGDIISTEQSNSSLIYGEAAILKLFRRIEPGRNPDVEIHQALLQAGNPHVAALLGYVSYQDGDATVAMLQTFLSAASDGWSLAAASIRDLYAEGDLHPAEVGGDFASESHRLGLATASVHADLARVLDTATLTSGDVDALVAGMHARLDAAVEVVPELGPVATDLRACFDAVASWPGSVTVQRVHGDYHLGQVLRTATGWTLHDFEGEPARPIAERRTLESPLRDVAGMLRSFDYAARHLLVDGHTDPQLDYRAAEWASRNRQAFLAGYTAGGLGDPAAAAQLLRAFEADKAVYECVYEARNRPHWLQIPLGSLARLIGQPRQSELPHNAQGDP